MSTKDTGGQAFPCYERGSAGAGPLELTDPGMTLRDYFAAKVVQAGIAKVVYRLPPTDFTERWQHEMAEAMAIYSEVLLPVVVLGD